VVTLATLFPLNSVNHRFSSGPATIPATKLRGVGSGYMVVRNRGVPPADDGEDETGGWDDAVETGDSDGGNEAVWLGLASAIRVGDADPRVFALGLRPHEEMTRTAAKATATMPTHAP
jgi:hypothetical protein